MTIQAQRALLTAVSVLCAGLSTLPAAARQVQTDSTASEVLPLGLRGVYFVPNQGQWSDSDVCFGFQSRGLDVAARESSLTMHLHGTVDAGRPARSPDQLTLTVTFPGSRSVKPDGADPQNSKFNYFVAGEGRTSQTGVPSFASIVYPNLYDGVDLLVTGSDQGVLKYEFHVAPGADYKQIRIAYDGVDSLCLDDAGDLHMATSFGTLIDKQPIAWQERSGQREIVSSHFDLVGQSIYRIALAGPVDCTRELTIDPDLTWLYLLGGAGDDAGDVGNGGITLDSEDNAILTGFTNSTDFEGRLNAYHGSSGGDATVVKVSPAGEVIWMTYLGGSAADWGTGIVSTPAGGVYVTGRTDSTDFEGQTNTLHGQSDAFLCSLDSDGALNWMNYLGGTDVDEATGISADNDGNAFVAGTTTSTDFEGSINAAHGNSDGFVCAVNPAGQLQWMTYIGGAEADSTRGIDVDDHGNAMITGDTISQDFESRLNEWHGFSEDAYVCRVSASGQAMWMRYLGGSSKDIGEAIAINLAGDAMVTGTTFSSSFDGHNNAFHGNNQVSETYVLRIKPDGTLQWMTYAGGQDSEAGFGIAIDSRGNALITGTTDSGNFEWHVNSYRGGIDAFICKVGGNGVVRWMLYLGGTSDEFGSGVAVTSLGDAVVAGGTNSNNFAGRNNSYHGGDGDAFIARIHSDDAPVLSLTTSCPSAGPIEVSWSGASENDTIALLYATSTGAFIIPGNYTCAGTTLGLSSNHLQIGYQGYSGLNGSRTLNSFVGPGACGGYLQLLDTPTCDTSNVVRFE